MFNCNLVKPDRFRVEIMLRDKNGIVAIGAVYAADAKFVTGSPLDSSRTPE